MKGTLLDFELEGAMCKTRYRLGEVKCNKPKKKKQKGKLKW